MSEENYYDGPILKSVEALFRELLVRLPEKSASMRVKSEPEYAMLELIPANLNAASISVIVPRNENEGVTLIAGKGSYFEIPKDGHRYTDLPLIEEMRTICDAVIAGKLEESVVLDGAEVLQGTGTIELPQRTTVRWRHLTFRPFGKKEKKHFRYEPFRSGGSSETS